MIGLFVVNFIRATMIVMELTVNPSKGMGWGVRY
jgi:hypothetical protein